MPKLNQIVAIEKGVKQETTKELSAAHHTLQKSDLFNGLQRNYTPLTEDGEKYPAESKNVQFDAKKTVRSVLTRLKELFDLTATRDYANCSGNANADLVINGETIAKNVPVPYLLWLEKQLQDLHTFVQKLPVLSPEDNWSFDKNRGMFVTETVQSAKTKKVKKPLVLLAPTKEHPGQAKDYDEDVIAGYWHQQKLSSAFPSTTIQDILQRIESVQKGVRFAREQANAIEAPPLKVADQIFRYIFKEEV